MEDVIDQLRELNEPVPVPLELPDEETLVEIQSRFSSTCPTSCASSCSRSAMWSTAVWSR